MRLYVLPPAFGLPSIDAECNAAVAFLQLCLKGQFHVIPSHDLDRPLPWLLDGQTQVTGFNGIVRYLAENGLDNRETSPGSKDGADGLAITSFVELHGQTLLDISLYVSFDNYRHVTRPAFTKVLPWYANYILPPRKRSAARSRTDHLGISSIDVDNVHEDMSNRPPGFDSVMKEQEFEAATQKRASLLLPRKETVRSLLQKPEHVAIFKLHALADNFFEPLQDMLASRQQSPEDHGLKALDCLVYGYLSLMLFPKLSQDWLASTMRRKYSKLVVFTEEIHRRLGLTTDATDVMQVIRSQSSLDKGSQGQTAGGSLRWRASDPSSTLDVTKYIGSGIYDQLPVIGSPDALHLVHAPTRTFAQRHFSALLLALVGSSAGLTYLALRTGVLIWPRGEEIHIFGRRRLADYGHLGAALAGISLVAPSAKARF